MYDLNQPTDVIDQMRDGEMTDEQIIKVCRRVIDILTTRGLGVKPKAASND